MIAILLEVLTLIILALMWTWDETERIQVRRRERRLAILEGVENGRND